MTRPKPLLPPTPDLKTHSSLSIATNLLLRCEHFFRSLAFLEHTSAEDPTKILQQIRSLCRDFHETLFIIDQTLYRHRLAHTKAKRLGHTEGEKEEGEDDEGYRVLSEVNEQLTDYAFLVGNGIHPWDAPYSFLEQKSASSSSSSTTVSSTTATTKPLVPNQVKFPPAQWKNRESRKTTTPLAGFPLVDRGIGDFLDEIILEIGCRIVDGRWCCVVIPSSLYQLKNDERQRRKIQKTTNDLSQIDLQNTKDLELGAWTLQNWQ
uniref:Uncharacterized protein n=1 Tax=Talaromyces marneffei PM1 TaxID=1077442 RepID=A0A093V999_TALMA